MRKVKRARAYDGRTRQEQARSTRERVIDVARAEFLDNGYGATTITTIAERAGVSAETIYKSFGGKAGLVRAIFERGLQGRGPTPAESRSDAMSAAAVDGDAIVDGWGALTMEVSPLVSPILLLVRAGAANEPDLASLLHDIDRARLARMKANARVLMERGFLRDDVTVDEAAEIMWIYTSPELYELLVERRGWSARKLGLFVAAAIKPALLRR